MPKRDIKDKEEELRLVFTLPSLSRIIFWILLLIVLSLRIIVFLRFQIWEQIIDKFELLFAIKEKEGETTKKNGLFY